MKPPLQKILISREQLQSRIKQLAQEINQDYQGQELVLVSVLKGSVIFLADLMQELDLDVEMGFLYLSSYRGETSPQGEVKRYLIPFPDIEDRHVMLVEDIFDTGASLSYAWELCKKKNPRSLKTCVLLVKQDIARTALPPLDYQGFTIPNEFVVGFGLDYKEKYRQLPYIAVLDASSGSNG
ncbi:MAG: hypoxanthine phosphoribosyltransferase [Candidatus Omnitrophica bacterium]|nr:hypoxanthine phosphoribosyltransferase [Candidatus Omnitrophota bacterium]